MKLFGSVFILAFALAFADAGKADQMICHSGAEVQLQRAPSVKSNGLDLISHWDLCADSMRGAKVMSRNCKDPDSCLVPIFKAVPQLNTWEPSGRVGNPAFHLCGLLNGVPSFIRYRFGKEPEVNATACIFSKKKILIDMDQLLGVYLDHLK